MKILNIVFEDDYLLVVDKPAGITVNKADTTRNELTVQDLIEKMFSSNEEWLNSDRESDFFRRAGIVHRLDKETSGLLVIAKTPDSFSNLQDQFKQRLVNKTYVALVHGSVYPKNGEINVPVGRLPWNRKKFGVLAGGKAATTKYRVEAEYDFKLNKHSETLTLLELNPETGRTHQIRVHLKYFNHPVFGDPLYAGRKTSRADRKVLDRIFLHAKTISFNHPKTGERLIFNSDLPQELTTVLELLNKTNLS